MEDFKKEIIIDMPDSSDMIADALAQAKLACDKPNKFESQISRQIKEFFDNKYGPTWQCIVGKSFNSCVSYESKHFIYFPFEGQLGILLYKIG